MAMMKYRKENGCFISPIDSESSQKIVRDAETASSLRSGEETSRFVDISRGKSKGIVFNIDIAFAVGIVALGLLFAFRSIPEPGTAWASAGLARLGSDYTGAMIGLGMFNAPDAAQMQQWFATNLPSNVNMSLTLKYYALSGGSWSLSSSVAVGAAPSEWFGGKRMFYVNSTAFGIAEYAVWPR